MSARMERIATITEVAVAVAEGNVSCKHIPAWVPAMRESGKELSLAAIPASPQLELSKRVENL